jgi:hypothetical protein
MVSRLVRTPFVHANVSSVCVTNFVQETAFCVRKTNYQKRNMYVV